MGMNKGLLCYFRTHIIHDLKISNALLTALLCVSPCNALASCSVCHALAEWPCIFEYILGCLDYSHCSLWSEDEASGGNQPSLHVLTLNHYTPLVAKSLPIISGLADHILSSVPYPTEDSFCSFFNLMSHCFPFFP